MTDALTPYEPTSPLGAVTGFNPAADDLLPLYLLRFERENTRRAYSRDLQLFFRSDTITLPQAARVSFVDVNAWIESLEAGDTRPATIQRKIASVRGFFAWLVALGVLTANPADRQLVRRGRRSSAQDRVITVLSREQARALVEAVDLDRPSGPRDRALLLTLLHGVLRRSEARAMDFEHVRRSGPYWVLELPRTKGGADQYVKLPDHVVAAIEEVRAVYGFRAGAVWRALSNNHYGRRLSGHSIYSIASKHAITAGIIDSVGAHTLRHTGCTLAIEGGATLQQVQAHARHKQLQTTMVYVHQRDRLKDSASDYIQI
jgi:site-specific recombinase XerD